MADNVVLDPGAGGASFATDDVAGNHYQRIKLTDGTADSATPVNVGGGGEANALRVTVASDSTGVLSVDDNGGSLTVDGTVGISGAVDTELPAAAALADGAGNPTTPTIGAGGLMWNGSGWDRIRGDTTNGIDVDVTRLPALVAGDANIGDVDIASIAAGTNLIGDVGIKPRTSGGFSVFRRLATADTNLATPKASAGQLFGWYIYNDGATEIYVKIYNKASNPTLAADTPVMTLPIPAGSAANVFGETGIAFSDGIAFAATGAIGDTDTTVLTANAAVFNLFYA